MQPDLYFVHAHIRNSLGDPVQALFARPCDHSTPSKGQLIQSDDSDSRGDFPGVLLFNETGVLKLIGVWAPWRRMGIATALWHTAQQISPSPLDKAPVRTALGEAWLQALGIDTPLEVLNAPMTSSAEASAARPAQVALDDEESIALRIAKLLGQGEDALPFIRAMCAPTREEASEQMRILQAGPR